MLPALADFLKSTLDESLKKPLQPFALFSATIFVFLNFFVIFPRLIDRGVGSGFLDPSPLWQGLLLAIVILILSYSLVALGSTILRMMTGELWADSPIIGEKLKTRQENAWKNLKGDIPTSIPDKPRDWQKQLDLDTRFPHGEKDQIDFAPTALGNILNATASTLWRQYGIDMTALWPHMETVIAMDAASAPLAARIDNEKATLDFLLNLAFVLDVFALENFLVQLGLRNWSALLWTLAAVILGLLAYRVSLGKARAWGDVVQMAFDLKRDKLRDALGLRKFTSLSDEREVWGKVSGWLQWSTPPGDIFQEKPWEAPAATPSGATWIATNNVKVELRSAITRERTPPAAQGQPPSEASEVKRHEVINYTVLISSATTVQDSTDYSPSDGAYVIISDPRVTNIDMPPDLKNPADWTNITVERSLITIGEATPAPAVLWRIDRLPPRGGVLRYRLAKLLFSATSDTKSLRLLESPEPEGAERKSFYNLQIANRGTETVTRAVIEVIDGSIDLAATAPQLRGLLAGPSNRVQEVESSLHSDGMHRWELGSLDLAPGEVANLACGPRQDTKEANDEIEI